ncbi:MAG: hypothetical protein FJZ08_05555 [Candidatus Omnitrophica bacterium]|nr:hypothetical protein [Candidatus Omnitrophota bacterium]
MIKALLRVILIQLLIFGQVAPIAAEAAVFTHTWDPTTYRSASSNVRVSGGEVYLAPDTLAVSDDTATDFTKGTLSNIVPNTDPAGLKLNVQARDQFVPLGQWSSLSTIAVPGSYSVYARLGDYIYCLLLEGDGRYFARFHITQKQWEYLEPLPVAGGVGAALTAGNGKIYCLRGGGGREAFVYTPPDGTYPKGRWQSLASMSLYGQALGASVVYVPAGGGRTSARLYATVGGDKTNFYSLDLDTPGATWTTKGTILSSVSYGGYLVYPPNSQFIFCSRGNADKLFFKYDIAQDQWSQMTPLPEDTVVNTKYYMERISGFWYPGRGDYVYVGCTYRYKVSGSDTYNYRAFLRLNYKDTNAQWEPIDDLPADNSTANTYLAIAYFDDISDIADSGGTLNYFSGANLTRPWQFDATNKKWITFPAPPTTGGYGRTIFYPGFGDYIYKLQGDAKTGFFRYSLSLNKWETLYNVPSPVYRSGTRLAYLKDTANNKDYIYCLVGNSSPYFYRYDMSTAPGENGWETLANFPSRQDPYDTSVTIYAENGSSIVGVPQDTSGNNYLNMDKAYIYAIRGAYSTNAGNKTSDFYRYDPNAATPSFQPVIVNNLPGDSNIPQFSGSAALTYPAGGKYIYAVAGYNTQHFHRFDISTGMWTRLANSPLYHSWYSSSLFTVDLGPGVGKFIYQFTGYDDSQWAWLWARYCIDS